MRILKLNDVKQKTGLGRSSIYKCMAENRFPKQLKLGLRGVGWLESDVEQWIADKVQAARQDAAA